MFIYIYIKAKLNTIYRFYQFRCTCRLAKLYSKHNMSIYFNRLHNETGSQLKPFLNIMFQLYCVIK